MERELSDVNSDRTPLLCYLAGFPETCVLLISKDKYRNKILFRTYRCILYTVDDNGSANMSSCSPAVMSTLVSVISKFGWRHIIGFGRHTVLERTND